MTASTHDAVGVDRALARVAAAWEEGNPESYSQAFTADADYTAFDGTHMSGRRAIADGHRDLFAGIMRNSRMVTEHRDVRFPAPDVAVACERGGIVMSWQKRRTVPTAKRRSSVTFVLVRRDGTWLVDTFHNTRYRPWSNTLLGRLTRRGNPT
ncbi:SgcJ/EcaC family oxidoreductase [Rhodococcus sp. HM1]|uniref:SgcJ/EcaC family oxidoreductase n=1 Tax=unclassified Rhodococcus (in: high G+C Gram-positive bacteria) TaxID=192944 RepID=UPI0018CF8855|nr:MULTISPECIES: SgcJ/EcaC family oxidoreductase [unclassified Rhodococcus (in: high G+C Gram-positive bacteria)]MBH0122650.1 SgcJ/EcaC family oxidoreductase [Rhodococcus sp. CX]MCK8675482.1 SgcJ/EcaC family oxidoreductase [Rhodococcus sp. HM1]